MVATRSGNGTATDARPLGHRTDAVHEALRHGSDAVRELVRLKQRRLQLGVERTAFVGAVGLAGIVALGVASAGAGLLLAWGLTAWAAATWGWPAWTVPVLAGSAVALVLGIALRWHGRRLRPADTNWERRADDADEAELLAAEQRANATLAHSAQDVARALTSPLGLLLAAVGGFAAYRTFRRHPLVGSALLGAARLGRRFAGTR
jgi:hypothetical protein